jgi:hypothetical protein
MLAGHQSLRAVCYGLQLVRASLRATMKILSWLLPG